MSATQPGLPPHHPASQLGIICDQKGNEKSDLLHPIAVGLVEKQEEWREKIDRNVGQRSTHPGRPPEETDPLAYRNPSIFSIIAVSH